MAEPNNRRISLRPIFEPFNLLDDEGIQPLSPNGYPSDSLDGDANLFGGLHCEPNDSLTGTNNGSTNNGSTNNGSTNNGSANGAASGNGRITVHPGFTTFIAAADRPAHGAFDHPADRILEELNNDPDIADLVAAQAAFAMSESRQAPHEKQHAESNGNGRHVDAPVNGDAARNGDAQRNGNAPHPILEPSGTEPETIEPQNIEVEHAELVADESAVIEEITTDENAFDQAAAEPVASDPDATNLLYVQNPGADFEHYSTNGAAVDSHPVEPQPVAPTDLEPAHDAHEIAPIADETQLVEHVELVHDDIAHGELTEPVEAAALESAESPLEAPVDAGDRGAHPAAGSMFMPYLVTEIRELRSRSHRRKSWWRRLFG